MNQENDDFNKEQLNPNAESSEALEEDFQFNYKPFEGYKVEAKPMIGGFMPSSVLETANLSEVVKVLPTFDKFDMVNIVCDKPYQKTQQIQLAYSPKDDSFRVTRNGKIVAMFHESVYAEEVGALIEKSWVSMEGVKITRNGKVVAVVGKDGKIEKVKDGGVVVTTPLGEI